MKYIAVLLSVLLSSATAHAQRVVRKGVVEKNPRKTVLLTAPAKYTVAQLSGKWQETLRRAGGGPVDFKDTMQLMIRNGRGEIRNTQTMTMNMKSDALIEPPATLAVGGDVYTIAGLTNGRLMLRDADYLRTLTRVDEFYFETVGKDSIKPFSYGQPVAVVPANIVGFWSVYRRDARPGVITESTMLIKSISLTNVGTGEVVVYAGNNFSETKKLTYTTSGTQLYIKGEHGDQQYTVFKNDGVEFIFGNEGGVVNYAKR